MLFKLSWQISVTDEGRIFSFATIMSRQVLLLRGFVGVKLADTGT
jgi:hypothetical protein